MPSKSLRVVHAVGWYFPDTSGGTEVYVDGLARHLREHDVESRVVAATDGDSTAEYRWNDFAVKRYPVPAADRHEIAGRAEHARFTEFVEWLRQQDVDIYHQHSWTRGCGLPHLRIAKQMGLRTVLTIHVPGATCLRGTMMLNGQEACDGRIDVARCTECWGELRGIPGPMASWQGEHPVASRRVSKVLPPSRLKTAFLTPALVTRRQADVAEMGQAADKVVAVCRWLYDALERNDLPPRKLAYCAQGVEVPPSARPTRPAMGTRTFRVGFVGRWDPVKGLHILVDAFRRLRADISAELIIHGLPHDAAYERHVRELAVGDRRIHFLPAVAREQISQVMAGFDVLAVPSLWMETGPLVVLEALVAGTPILGSALGGISELVGPESGTLVPAGDVLAWTRAIEAIEASARTSHVSMPPTPRSSRDVASEMAALYRELAADRLVAPAGIPSHAAG